MRVYSVVDVITNSSSTVFSFAKYDDRVVEAIKKITEALGVYDVDIRVYRRYDEKWLQDNFMLVFGSVLEDFASKGLRFLFLWMSLMSFGVIILLFTAKILS